MKLVMMKMHNFLTTVLLFSVALSAHAQLATQPQLSPLAMTAVRYKDSYIKITYSQPHKRGREIFGALVPYDQIWRTGANEATEITITKEILFNNIHLRPGTYSIFTIPTPIKWTIIINSEVGLWGSYNYNAKMNVLTTDIPVQNTGNTVYEPFTIKLIQNNDKAELNFMWDRTQVSVPIKFL